MEIVVNGRFLAKPATGVTRVGRELLRALIAESRAGGPGFTIAAPPGAQPPLPPGVNDLAQAPRVRIVPGPHGNLGEQTLYPWRHAGDRLIGFCNTMPLAQPNAVLWLHDAQVFDAAESYAPAYRTWHQTLFRVACARRVPIVTVSAFSKSRLVAHGADAARVDVIHNGGDHILQAPEDPSVLDQFGLEPGGYLLLMGSRAKHKNLPFAIEALLRHGPRSPQLAVVGLGQHGAYASASAPGAGDPRVTLLPPISDGALRALYARARAVMVPSLMEGFGLPAAEAMWVGAPLLLAKRASLPEIGADAALYFDPEDAKSLAAAATRIMDDGARQDLIAAGARRRALFAWSRAAKDTIARYFS